MEYLSTEELNRLKLFGKRVLIQLPAETDSKEQTLKSGITASFIYSDKEKYAPVQGIIVKRSADTHVKDGDHVFFHYLCWGNAQHTAEQFKNGHYDGSKTAIECNGVKYLLMFETEIFFAKRGDRYVSMNDYLLLRGIPVETKKELLKGLKGENLGHVYVGETAGLIVAPNSHSENHRLDIAEVVACPEGCYVNPGDIVFPDKHFDVPIEYDILQTLGETLYYVHKDVILAKRNNI